jgi:tripartite-type tricarboxylate transporter receptor subunit TctC
MQMSVERPLCSAIRVLLAAIAVGAVGANPALAQKWPEKTVRIVTPFATGGGTDFFARILAQRLSESLGQQFIVENRPGAGSTVGTESVAKSAPDGYTYLMTSASFAFNPGLYPALRYDSIKDFAPVSLVVTVPHVITVHPSLPVKNLQDLVKLARSRPGEVLYSTAGQGSAMHLAGALFATVTKTNLVQVPYKGSPPAAMAVISGEATMMFPTIETVLPLIRGKRLRPIAVSTRDRVPALPDIPTAIESGFKDYEVVTWFGVLAPAGTPPAIVEQMSAEISKAMAIPATRERILQEGATPVASSPAQFDRFLRGEIGRWTRIIRDASSSTERSRFSRRYAGIVISRSSAPRSRLQLLRRRR